MISSLALFTVAESKANEDANNVNKKNNFIVNIISCMLEDDILVTNNVPEFDCVFSIFITSVTS